MISNLVGARDNLWEVSLLFILAFDNSFYDRGMVGTQIHKNMCDPRLFGRFRPVLSCSEFMKHTSHKLSKKAKLAV
jgi:hypothetical protein